MNHKILIAVLASVSLFAAAQSQTDKQKPKPSTTQVSGNKTSMDDWTQRAVKPASSSSDTKATHVAVGDVNGDGRADVMVSNKNSAHATEAAASTAADSSKDQAPRDAASGQASGKRQHQPITITKETDKATPLDAASGQASGKRMHRPVAITKEVGKTSPQ